MIKLFFLNLWSNFKRSPIISLIILTQLVLTGFLLFLAINKQTELDIDNSYIQNSYGKNTLFYVHDMYCTNQEMYEKLLGRTFTTVEETDYSDLELYDKLIAESDLVDTVLQIRKDVSVPGPISDWGIDDNSTSDYSFYTRNTKLEGYDFNGKHFTEYKLNSWVIGSNFLDFFKFQLDSGRYFSEEDFTNFDPYRVPVILGYDYKGHFDIGDTFQASLFSFPGTTPGGQHYETMTFEVIGFIAEDQFIYDTGGTTPYPLDTYMVLPYFYKTLEEWIDFQANNPQFGERGDYIRYYLKKFTLNSNIQYITPRETEKAAIEETNRLLKEAGIEGYSVIKPVSPEQLADNYQERTDIEKCLLFIMLTLSLLSIIFTSINNISNNIKTYAIHSLVGAPRSIIMIYSILETFIYCVLGFLGGYLWYESIHTYSGFHSAPEYIPSLISSLTVIGIFTLLACAFTIIFVNIKLREYSVSSLIRGNEVKKGKGLSLYKIITFFMFAFVSICITFVTSYNYQVEHIDKYQRHFYSKNAWAFNTVYLLQENPPEIKFDHDIEVENYIIDYLIRELYDSVMGPSMRATYFKGNVELPEMTWGRYFTEEEVKGKSNYVVVGKNVVEDFIEEKDGKMIYKYSDKEYEVIGIMGREGHDTTIDNWVIFTMPTLKSIFGSCGTYIVDAPTTEEITAAIENYRGQLSEISRYQEQPYTASIDIGISSYILNVFIALIALTAVVFGIYYIDKIKHIINVKKFLGYSRIMIFADTAGLFMFVSTIAFAVGNAAMWVLSKTLLKDFILFSAFRINLPVLTFSFGMILLISFLFSVFAINKSFRGSARDLKRG